MENSRGMKPTGQSSSLPENWEFAASWDGHGSKAQLGEGRGAVGLAGDSCLDALARKWEKRGSLAPAPNDQHRKQKNVACLEPERRKGEKAKTKSCQTRDGGHVTLEFEEPGTFPSEIPVMNQLRTYMTPLCPAPGKEGGSSGHWHAGHTARLRYAAPGEVEGGLGPIFSLGDLKRPREDAHLALPLSALREEEPPEAVRGNKNTVLRKDEPAQRQGKPWRGTKPSGCPAQLVGKPTIAKRPQRKSRAEPTAETWREPRTSLGMHMLQSVQVFHALGRKHEMAAGSGRISQPAPKRPGRSGSAAEDLKAGLEGSRLPPLLSPSRAVGRAQGPGVAQNGMNRMDAGLRQQPLGKEGERPYKAQAVPESKAAFQKAKRKWSDPEPSHQVCKKARSSLGPILLESGQVIPPRSHKKPGCLQGAQLARQSQGPVQIPAEGQGATTQPQAPLRFPPELRPVAQSHIHLQRQRHLQPQSQALPRPGSQAQCHRQAPFDREALCLQPIPGLTISKPISEEQRPEREAMKRQAQLERQKAAQYTSAGKRDFFRQRQKDLEIANFYGYMF